MVLLEVVGSDGAVGGAQMFEKVDNADGGKAHDGVLKLRKVGVGDGFQDELFEVGVDNAVGFELFLACFVDPFCLGDLVLGASIVGWGSWICWMGWGGEGSGEGHEAGVVDDKEEVAMDAGSKGAVDGPGVFEDFFFEKVDGSVVGRSFVGAVQWCECGVGKGAGDGAHGGGGCRGGRREVNTGLTR